VILRAFVYYVMGRISHSSNIPKNEAFTRIIFNSLK
jgi:hypothetical protein